MSHHFEYDFFAVVVTGLLFLKEIILDFALVLIRDAFITDETVSKASLVAVQTKLGAFYPHKLLSTKIFFPKINSLWIKSSNFFMRKYSGLPLN